MACACQPVNDVGEPCAGEPHARFDAAAGGNPGPVGSAARSPDASRRPYKARSTPASATRPSAGRPALAGSPDVASIRALPDTLGQRQSRLWVLERQRDGDRVCGAATPGPLARSASSRFSADALSGRSPHEASTPAAASLSRRTTFESARVRAEETFARVGSVQAVAVAARRDADLLRALAYAGAWFGRQSGGNTWKGSRSSRSPACSTCRSGRGRVLCRPAGRAVHSQVQGSTSAEDRGGCLSDRRLVLTFPC